MSKYHADHSFFDTIDTEEKAYWLGFIAADGCIKNSQNWPLSVALAARDCEHLNKLRVALRSDHVINIEDVITNFGAFRRCSLRICGLGLCKGLMSHGVVPRKSLIISPPPISRVLMRHYWRGYFDGNGCITYDRVRGSWHVSLTSGSALMTEAFADFARDASTTNAAAHRYRDRSYVFNVGGRFAIPILRALYDNATVYLDRKHALYLKAVAARERANTE